MAPSIPGIEPCCTCDAKGRDELERRLRGLQAERLRPVPPPPDYSVYANDPQIFIDSVENQLARRSALSTGGLWTEEAPSPQLGEGASCR